MKSHKSENEQIGTRGQGNIVYFQPNCEECTQDISKEEHMKQVISTSDMKPLYSSSWSRSQP